VIVDALLSRGPILRPQALNHEESHAVGPCPSRTSPATATADTDSRDRCPSPPDGIRDPRAHPRPSRPGAKTHGGRQ
jgi:hypothetical protein